jgi:hypothetical protein
MKKKRFSVEQIIGVLKQAQIGVPVAEVIRKAGSASRRSIAGSRNTQALKWIRSARWRSCRKRTSG